MGREVAVVVHNEPVGAEQRLLTLQAPQTAALAQPGQFVHVRVAGTYDPLLRRPLSILRAEASGGRIWLLVKAVGRGTRLLCQAEAGTKLDLLGPLGRGFPEPPAGGELILVAGGVGVAPLIFWAEHLQTFHAHRHVVAIYGARSEEALACWLDLAARCDEFYVATEDGSAGELGLASQLLGRYLAERTVAAVYACGPRAMLAAVAELCQRAGVACWVGMEQWMGCGVGACLGCVVPAASSGYLRVCTDGPVFAAADLDWQVLREQLA
jgi:dihydroorotate dehydrogenase electron transfer subunit